MSVYESKLNINSESFATNRQDQLKNIQLLNTFRERTTAASEKRRARFEERGQLTPRDRLAILLDPGMPFLELYNVAGYGVDDPNPDTSLIGSSTIGGIGFVNGVRCMIYVDDSGINAGAAMELTFKKGIECLKMALHKKLPFIHLVESAGANLMRYKVEGWALGGEIFYMLGRLSAAGVPTFTVLHGPSTAGGAYMPGMSDYNVGVKHNGMAALGGAALVQAATGEVSDERELGGTEMHASVSGLMEYLAENDADGIAQVRDLVGRIGWNARCAQMPPRDFVEPQYSSEEILGLVPVDYKIPYDARELVARIVDGSDFSDFKSRYGASMVCLHAKVYGHAVGILCNNGPIDPDGAAKATHFIQLCDQADIPLVFLNNITGYMVGLKYERAGMIKMGSKMIQAVSNVRVPKISFYVGASFGAGNYGMAGIGYHPDFLFTWPSAVTGVMGGEQAAGTMEQVAISGAKRRGVEVDMEALAKQRQAIESIFNSQNDAFTTSGKMLDCGMIDPRDTRRVLGVALDTLWEAKHRELHPNAFGVARI